MYRMVVSDLDGTLLNSQKQITKATVKEIEKLSEKDVIFVAATGRSDVMTKPYFRQLVHESIVVACDGAVIRNIRTGNILFEKRLSSKQCKEVFQICQMYGLSYYVFSKDALVAEDPQNDRFLKHKEFNKSVIEEDQIPMVIVDHLEEYVENHSVYKIVASHYQKEYLDTVAEVIKERTSVDAIRSGKHVLAIKAKGVSKAEALKWLTSHLHISMDQVVAFGDEVNDIEMLKAAGLGIAMENADDVVKLSADDVTSSNDEDGVANKLKRLFK
ncbi:HAD family hydrolase [Anaerostipes faecalis]|uniref:HAD family hydrolase n=1 Tax=Anaerostipes faecalis TaxID=2738446 RepID=UPI003F0D913B